MVGQSSHEKVKLVKTGRISELKSENEAKFLYAQCPKTQCITPLWAYFWGTSWIPNWAYDSLLEIPVCLLSNPSGIFQFGCHLLLQNCNLPRLVPAGAKSGRKAIFGVFLTFKTIQNLMKYLNHSRACIIYHNKPKNIKFSSRICSNHKRASSDATHRVEILVLQPKFQKWQKFLQICWNLEWRSPIMSPA